MLESAFAFVAPHWTELSVAMFFIAKFRRKRRPRKTGSLSQFSKGAVFVIVGLLSVSVLQCPCLADQVVDSLVDLQVRARTRAPPPCTHARGSCAKSIGEHVRDFLIEFA